ncbi:hypothetical protein [Modestobacter versicolor]|uniref:Uncharacterized protein n=1 Tax=Modestobacter versicolor TaxID=429133 RepID=A0A839Y3J0_9ACTN|nr:hypothetical protein [Modestobacter versicolor]MBB3677007.1 hypothetical protein [Modestobacter versicolor]
MWCERCLQPQDECRCWTLRRRVLWDARRRLVELRVRLRERGTR